MIVSVPKEIAEGERRVAIVPKTAGQLVKSGLEVLVESRAGVGASYRDEDYEAQGAKIESDAETVLGAADVVLKVRAPAFRDRDAGRHEVDAMKEGSTLIALLFPLAHLETVRRLNDRGITAFSMDLMPRITRAQSMDSLSAMSSAAGYKAVILAAGLLPRFFPMLMTAAGTITPARVLVLGAGVAGLQAIATARRLGAVVEAFDVRPEVKEQVESLGARFVELDVDTADAQDAGGYAREQTRDTQARIRELLRRRTSKCDVIVTTALVPGKKAPVLVTGEMVGEMRPGSVIVDLAAEQGGNCEWTEAGQEVVKGGVTIAGPLNLPGELAVDSSNMYSRTISSFLSHLVNDGQIVLDLDDELTSGPLVTRNGEIVHEPTRAALSEEKVVGES